MINTFSLFLIIITSISGFFWLLRYLCIRICNNDYFRVEFLRKIKNWYYTSSSMCRMMVFFCANIFNGTVSMFPVLFIIFIIRSFIFEPFQIPSGSMMPTLLIGDFILVKKFAYGVKNPVNQNTLISFGHPNRGDVIVFKYPKDPTLDYIKRVIGEPGDRILYNVITKQLTIYPDCINNNVNASLLPVTYSNVIPSNFMQVFHVLDNGKINTTFMTIEKDMSTKDIVKGIRLIKTTESLNGVKYDILTMIPPSDQDFIKRAYNDTNNYLISEWIVPKGEYFVMGDNRDNSLDSRYWGYVPERNIVGKATIIWMSVKKQEGSWPTGLRFHRISFIK